MKRHLYKVTFDDNNNPVNAEWLHPMSSPYGHGLGTWKEKDGVNYFIWLCVEATNSESAIEIAKEMAQRRSVPHTPQKRNK